MDFSVKINVCNVDDNRLLGDLRDVAKRLNRNTVTIAEYNELWAFHSSTIQRRFKSWFVALEKSGLAKSRSLLNLTDDELLDNIRIVRQKLGRQPKYVEMKAPLSNYSAGTYENRFGGWNRALLLFQEWIQSDNTDEEELADTRISSTESTQETINHITKREISDRLRFRVLMGDGFVCKSCGASPLKSLNVELHVDHVIPWSKGGETVESNLQTKCSQCNLGKGNAFMH